MTVDLYVQTSTRNPARTKTVKARWLISTKSNGQEVKRDGTVVLNNSTPKQAALVALADALSRFNKAAVIKLYISDDFVRNMLIANMPKRWEDNDWHKIRLNQTLAHEMQWKYVKGFLADHAVSYARGDELTQNQTLKEMEWRMNNVRGK